MTRKKPEILLVDDDPTNLQLLSVALANDFKLFIAHSGAMALQVASRSPPDLILLDVMMPEIHDARNAVSYTHLTLPTIYSV